MLDNSKSFLQLLQDREIGFTRPSNHKRLVRAGMDLAESHLVADFKLKDIGNVSPDIRSSYVISCNTKGHAAISHSNRTISIVDTKRMIKISEIQSIDRTIWTIAYHPRIPSLLATGSVGGIVTVYWDYIQRANIHESYGNQMEFGNIIPSMCFHPSHDYVAYSSRKDVKIWDWQNNTILYTLAGNSTIRFMKFSPLNNMLITIQSYQKYTTSDCIQNFLNAIASVSLVLNSAFDPCYVNDVATVLINKLIILSYKCHDECDSQQFLNESNLDQMLDNFKTTITIWHRKLDSFSPENCAINDNIKCTHFFQQMRKYIENCNAMNEDHKMKFISTFEKGEQPVKVALQLCLNFSWKLLHEYLRQKCRDKVISLYPEDFCPSTPKILQVWNFDSKPDISQSWYGSITQCESHNDVSVDVSNCGRKVAVFYRKLNGDKIYSRLRVFGIEQHNLGQLLHNIHPNLLRNEEFIGVTFSPSSNYLIMVARKNTETKRSLISVHRLCDNYNNRNNVMALKTFEVERNVGFVKWAPNPGDGILLGFSTHVLSHWSY